MTTLFRILYTVGCLLSVFWTPFWVTIILASIGFYFFDWYVEGVLVLTLSDIFFGVPLMRFHGITVVGTLIGAILFAVIEALKRFTRYGTI